MFVYNITTKVDHEIMGEWLRWEKEIHIPEIMATGLFIEYKFFQLLEHDDDAGQNFVIQFIANRREDYDAFLNQFAPRLQNAPFVKWGEKTVSFQTLLQNVQ
jgi:hypothetical protein